MAAKAFDFDDSFDIDSDDLPSAEIQLAVVDEIQRLLAEGKSEHEAANLVFDHNLLNGKLH